MISLVANLFYGEKYVTHQMKHQWQLTDDAFHVGYQWKVGNEWNYLQAIADKDPVAISEGSEEEFITEHYWGYTTINPALTGAYEVVHPKWRVHHVKSFDMHCSIEKLYGPSFREALSSKPASVFLAEGSQVQVMNGSKIVLSAL